jgi:hypothetical protein
MQEKYKIFADKGISNIFEGALLPHLDTQTVEVIGYRLESIKRENVRVIARMPKDTKGIYKATTFFDNQRRKGKRRKSAFFPKTWTKDDVISAIYEAYQNKTVRNEIEKEYVGKTSDGMNIILCLDEASQVIDAAPIQDSVIEGNRKRKSKRLCNTCQQPKHYVCLEHHNFKKKGIRKILAIIKRYSRKFCFYFEKKLGFEE